MKITIRRSGGFAGAIGSTVVRDTGGLGARDQKSVAQAINTLERLARQHRAVGADFVRYDVAVDEAGNQRNVSFFDDGSDAARVLAQAVATIEAAPAVSSDG